MAQKTNTLSLRLNKRLNWNTLFCVHNFNDYSNQVWNTNKVTDLFEIGLTRLKLMSNRIIVKKFAKNYSVSSSGLDQNFFFLFVNKLNLNKNFQNSQYQSIYLRLFQSIIRKFTLNHTQLFIQRQKSLTTRFKPQNWILTPKIFTAFARNQIVAIDKLNINQHNFVNNLQKNLLNLITKLLKTLKYNVLGVKIICCGRWKKTNTGRTQKIYLKFGQIQSANTANKILFDSINQKTNYGAYSIKIWIAYQ